MDLLKLTRKQLAEQLYDDLCLIRGIRNENNCEKAKWVKRVLNGCGFCKPMKKEEIIKAIMYNKSVLANK